MSKPDVPMGKLLCQLQLNIDSKRLILKAISDAALPDKALQDLTRDCQPNDSKLLFPLLRHALLIQKLHTAETSRARRANADDAKEAFTNDPYHRKAFKFIKSLISSPLQFLARQAPGLLGQASGTITAHPNELDDIVAAQYCLIYDGNVEDQHAHAENFVFKYTDYIYEGPTLSLPP